MNKKLDKHIKDEKTGIKYTLVGDYYIPDLKISRNENQNLQIGKYGRLRLNYLKNYRKGFYNSLLISGKLTNHLIETNKKAEEKIDLIVTNLKANSNLTEEMKDTSPLYWVGMMNNFKNQAEEIILKELIFI